MTQHKSRISRLEKSHASEAMPEKEIPQDPIAFARCLNLEPDPWQRDLLTATEEHIILNCSRQSGKSTIVAVLALHHALRNPKSLVLVLSPSQRQSEELLRKIATFHRELGRPGGSEADSATTLELGNGSRFVALPGSETTTRGYSPSLVLIDEAAQVSEEIYYAVRPMLAVSRGRLILLSTPYGKRGIFWQAWNQESDWKRVKVTADQCPRISHEFLKQERRTTAEWYFAQEYCCEFMQDGAAVFKEGWVQYYDPNQLPLMDTIIQSWDTAQTKSATSDYVVGQVWGRKGADFYLLDQVRGRMDFDEIVKAIRGLSAKWPHSTAKILERQTLGAALSSHLKHEIPGLIPITVKDSKALRALNCVPVWQSHNVYLPAQDNGTYAWVRDYVQELLTFPNAAHDDQVDATTLALNQLQGRLFPESKECVVPAEQVKPSPSHYYCIGWVPARADDNSTLVVYDTDDNVVVHFERTPAANQITRVYETSATFGYAVVRAMAGPDEAMLRALESKGVDVDRVPFDREERAAAYENLGMLINNRAITYPDYPELMAELDVFKSDFTYGEAPDYSLQVAQQSAIHALCLVTYDVDPEAFNTPIEVFYSHDYDRFLYGRSGWW